MIENKCVQTNEPEQELAKHNALGWKLLTAISQYAGILLFFEREQIEQQAQMPVALPKAKAKK